MRRVWKLGWPAVLFLVAGIAGACFQGAGSVFSGASINLFSSLRNSLIGIAATDMPAPALLAGLIAASTLVSEDLTCIAAGLMVAQGRVSFGLGTFACFIGIFVGDMLLFLAGRYLGRPALHRVPLKWFIRQGDVERSSAWLTRRAGYVIAASRFVPGARLPTYFAAGALNTRLWRFSFWFLIAAAVWTPLLVGASRLLGAEVIESALLARQSILLKAAVAGLVVFGVAKLAVRLSTHKGRRLLVSSWRRLTRWEFWPAWVFYVPIALYVVGLALRHRSLTLFTASNPAIPTGGFVGESKIEILARLKQSSRYLAYAELIEASAGVDSRLRQAERFLGATGFCFPVVLKPNAGERGSGVRIARSFQEVACYLSKTESDTIIQEYAPGVEFGVFYYRLPGEERGRVFSITEKRMTEVVGDGTRTLEDLILDDDRAVCKARFFLERHHSRSAWVPPSGERVPLVEIGTHCKGAMFLDGNRVKTPALEEKIDEISRSFDGFYFGRFDIRTPSIDDFREGRNFKIVELNGVTSEATHIYDPANSLIDAYRVLTRQWRLAFEIGAMNYDRGFKPATIRELVSAVSEHRRRPRPDFV